MTDDILTQTELFEELPEILTIHQVRSALGVGRTAVYRLLRNREIPCFKIGNAYKIPKVGLIAYIQNSCEYGKGEERK